MCFSSDIVDYTKSGRFATMDKRKFADLNTVNICGRSMDTPRHAGSTIIVWQN